MQDTQNTTSPQNETDEKNVESANTNLANKPDTEEDKFQSEAILANIGEGLVVTGKGGKIITFNKAAEDMLGWSTKESIGQPLKDIIKIEYFYEDPDDISSHITKSPLYFVRKNGSKFPVAMKVTSYAQGANIFGTITLFRDITSEQTVDTMKNEFISLASHQLRTPLTAIKWYSEMLVKGDEGKLNSQQQKYANNVYDSTNRMIELVNTLLNISRIESGRIIVEPIQTDIQKLVQEVIQDVKIRYADKKQHFTIDLANNLKSINIDPKLIRQVYLNLLTNASKYTPNEGSISVNVHIDHEKILSSVTDTGYGIPEKDRDKIFGKFYRGENVVSKVSDGSGLGLYFIKLIVEYSQGKIWFTSVEDKGTTFYFSLPAAGMPAKKGVVSIDS